ncbi:ATP-dependent helicase, partial [Vibrio parahaemolyticus]|nr:ATP-dependent helicase [Vibrio parahaemolyticus]
EAIEENDLTKYNPILDTLLLEEYSSFDIALALLKMYLDEKKIFEGHEEIEQIDTKKKYNSSGINTRLHLNVGKSSGISPRHILSATFEETGLSKKIIGNIDLYDDFSFIEVPAEYDEIVINGLNGKKIRGTKVRVERANAKKKKSRKQY